MTKQKHQKLADMVAKADLIEVRITFYQALQAVTCSDVRNIAELAPKSAIGKLLIDKYLTVGRVYADVASIIVDGAKRLEAEAQAEYAALNAE